MEEFDAQGTELWNIAARMTRHDVDDRTASCLVRVFAFRMLESGSSDRDGLAVNRVRLLNAAHRTAKACLDALEFDLMVQIMTSAAQSLQLFEERVSSTRSEYTPILTRVNAEHNMLRMALAWKQGKLEVAESFFEKIAQAYRAFEAQNIEEFLDILYEIGKDLYEKKEYHEAVIWLERIYDVLTDQLVEEALMDTTELKLSATHHLVKSLQSLRTPHATSRAHNLISMLERDHPDKLMISLLKLELLNTEPTPDARQYFEAIGAMFKSIHLTKSNFKTIMHHMHKLKDLDVNLAIQALDQLIAIRLVTNEEGAWLERAVVTRLWMTALTFLPSLEPLRIILDAMMDQGHPGLTAPAAHASQALIWKQADAMIQTETFDLAEAWCQIALHPVFQNSGNFNRAKVVRKMITCSLARKNYAASREMFFQLPEVTQADPKTRILAYKIALRTGDANLAAASLDIICKHSSKNANLLFACIAEAQVNEDKAQTVIALQRLLRQYDYQAPQGVSLLILLRCTAKLQSSELRTGDPISGRLLEDLCRIYETAAQELNGSEQTSNCDRDQQHIAEQEADWFSRNCFNFTLDHCTNISASHILRLTTACSELLMYRDSFQTLDQKVREEIERRSLFCSFLAAAASVVLARTEQDAAMTQTRYLGVRKAAHESRDRVTRAISSSASMGDRQDLTSKYMELLHFELEACLKLEDWQTIQEVYTAVWNHGTPQRWDTLADLTILISDSITAKLEELHRAEQSELSVRPDENAMGIDVGDGLASRKSTRSDLSIYLHQSLAFLRTIIEKTWVATADLPRLCRWLRCLFQLASSAPTEVLDNILSPSYQLALETLAQATVIAGANPMTFPPAELEWLATTAFNKAVDAFNLNDDAAKESWGMAAIALAEKARDEGVLADVLRDSFAKM